MSDWREIVFSSVLKDDTISYGVVQPGTHTHENSVPIIRVNNIKNGKIISDDILKIKREIEEKHVKTRLQGGELLITVVGSVGECAIVPPDLKGWNVARAVSVARIKSEYDVRFIKYCFKTEDVLHQLYGSTNDTVQPTLNLKELKNIKLRIPLKPEQQSIAEVLSSLDDKIDLLHRQNKTLEQMAETLFRQWFVVEAKDEWPSDILDNLFDIGIGRTPPRKEQHWFTTNPNDFKWISIKDMGNEGVYMDTTSENLTAQAVEKFNIPIIPADTVILSFKMTIGRLGITTERMLSNEAIAHFKLKKDSTLYPEYLYLYLKTYRWEQLGSTSSIVEAINSKMIKEMELVVPSKNTLVEFKKIIDPYFLKVKQNQKQLKNLISLRDLLLPKLMNGTVRVINN